MTSCGGGGGSNPTGPGTGGTTGGSVAISTNTLSVGQQLTLTVSLSNETDLRQASLEISFNEDVIQFNSYTKGNTVGDMFAVVTFNGTYPNRTLLASFANCPLNPLTPSCTGLYTGSGTLVTIVFDAVGTGSTNINFNNLDTTYYYGDGSTKVPLLLSQSVDVV